MRWTDCEADLLAEFTLKTTSNRGVEIWAFNGLSIPDAFLVVVASSIDLAMEEYQRHFSWFPELSRTYSILLNSGGSTNQTCPLRGEIRMLPDQPTGGGKVPEMYRNAVTRSDIFHEAFHLMQQAHNRRHDWSNFLWYAEGTATWAAARYTGNVKANTQLNSLFKVNKPGARRGLTPLEGKDPIRIGYQSIPYWAFLERLFWDWRSGPTILSDLIHPRRMRDFNNDVSDSLADLVKVYFQRDLGWLYAKFAEHLCTGKWHEKPDGSSFLDRWDDLDTRGKLEIPSLEYDPRDDVVLSSPVNDNYRPPNFELTCGELRFIRVARDYGDCLEISASSTGGNEWVAVIEEGSDGKRTSRVVHGGYGIYFKTAARRVVFGFAGPHEWKRSASACTFSVYAVPNY